MSQGRFWRTRSCLGDPLRLPLGALRPPMASRPKIIQVLVHPDLKQSLKLPTKKLWVLWLKRCLGGLTAVLGTPRGYLMEPSDHLWPAVLKNSIVGSSRP